MFAKAEKNNDICPSSAIIHVEFLSVLTTKLIFSTAYVLLFNQLCFADRLQYRTWPGSMPHVAMESCRGINAVKTTIKKRISGQELLRPSRSINLELTRKSMNFSKGTQASQITTPKQNHVMSLPFFQGQNNCAISRWEHRHATITIWMDMSRCL